MADSGQAVDTKVIEVASLPLESGLHSSPAPPEGGQLALLALLFPPTHAFLPQGESLFFGTNKWRIVLLKNHLCPNLSVSMSLPTGSLKGRAKERSTEHRAMVL